MDRPAKESAAQRRHTQGAKRIMWSPNWIVHISCQFGLQLRSLDGNAEWAPLHAKVRSTNNRCQFGTIKMDSVFFLFFFVCRSQCDLLVLSVKSQVAIRFNWISELLNCWRYIYCLDFGGMFSRLNWIVAWLVGIWFIDVDGECTTLAFGTRQRNQFLILEIFALFPPLRRQRRVVDWAQLSRSQVK